MSTYTKIVCKKGTTLIIKDGEIECLVADAIEVEVPIHFDNHSVTEIVHLHELADSWIREHTK